MINKECSIDSKISSNFDFNRLTTIFFLKMKKNIISGGEEFEDYAENSKSFGELLLKKLSKAGDTIAFVWFFNTEFYRFGPFCS